MLAYAMTINKSQSMGFSRVGIYLPNPVFAHGQLYVALSRAKNPSNTKILMNHIPMIQGRVNLSDQNGMYTSNVVLHDALIN